MSRGSTLRQIFQLLWEKKLWWMIPMVTVLLIIGVIVYATAGSAFSPFIYALF